MIRAILVDDELPSLKTLEWQLHKYCHDVEIIAACGSAAEGIDAITNNKPDVVFLDIEMPRMNGFDMLEKLKPIGFIVIFITAYDKFAIRAFRCSALDYLLKPVDKVDLEEAVEKIKKYHGQNHQNQDDRIELLLDQVKYLQQDQPVHKIALTTLDSYVFVDVSEIIHCASERNYTRVYLKGGKNIVVAKTLKLVEELISSRNFFRTHHSYLINLNNIKKMTKEDGGYIVMNNDAVVPLSRGKREDFFSLFSKL